MGGADKKIILSVNKLGVTMNQIAVIDNLSFETEEGDVLAIIGPNGAGKTILFRALLGMIPYRGEIKWKEGVRIGYVPQRMEIETDIPLTVREFFNLRRSNGFSETKVREMAKSVSLPESILNSGLGEISIGQRQRILIAWALLGEPEVLLFDEPTADIDVQGQESIYNLLHHLQDKYNLTIILISHDLNIVYRYAKEVLCLNRQLLCFGSPREVLSPKQMHELYGGGHTFFHHFDEKHYPSRRQEQK